MYTCLSDILRRKNISFYVHFKIIINSQRFKTVKHNGWNIKNRSVYIFIYYNLCLTLNIFCSTAHDFTLRCMPLQQIGTVLDMTKFTKRRVSSEKGWDFYGIYVNLYSLIFSNFIFVQNCPMAVSTYTKHVVEFYMAHSQI